MGQPCREDEVKEQLAESEDKACERGRTVMVRNEVKKEQEGRTSGVNVSWKNSQGVDEAS